MPLTAKLATALGLLAALTLLAVAGAGGPAAAAPGSAHPLVSGTPTPCTLFFTDVPGTQPFYAPIMVLACQGVLSGYADGTFQPGANITRGQSAKVVANSAGFADLISSTQQTFADVPPDSPFWLYVERAALHNTISGYACGGPGEPCDGQQRPYFRPGANVTRGQLAKIVVAAQGYSDPIPADRQTFADIPPAQPFWLYVERAALHTLISGYACGGPGEPCDAANRPYFRAGNPATRGQTSKIVAHTFFPGVAAPPWLPLLRLGRTQDPDTLLPHADTTLVGANFENMIFNGLVRQDENGNLLPDLAATVPTFDNGGAVYTGSGDDERLVVTYHLKHGVHWYDGVEFTAADVLFTYHLILDVNFPALDRYTLMKYASVTSPDPYTVIFNYLSWSEAAALLNQDPDTYAFLKPYVDAHVPVTDNEYNANFGMVLPAHALASIPPGDLFRTAYAHQPWGTGPYYVSRNLWGQVIQLEANPNYNVTANPPAIPHITSPVYLGTPAMIAALAGAISTPPPPRTSRLPICPR